jgi:DNA-binding response OmpR family regulator
MKNGSKILIIDDDKSILDSYSRKFSSAGFSVTTCNDATQAFDLAKKTPAQDHLVRHNNA